MDTHGNDNAPKPIHAIMHTLLPEGSHSSFSSVYHHGFMWGRSGEGADVREVMGTERTVFWEGRK